MTAKSGVAAALEIKRLMKASRERVYAAWTDPEQLQQWFGPAKVRTRALEADVRVGGKFRWDITSPEGEEMTVKGEYRELEPGRKIVFSWQWQEDAEWEGYLSIVTVELEETDKGTEVRLRHESLPSEKSRQGHTEGWNSVLDKLEEYLER